MRQTSHIWKKCVRGLNHPKVTVHPTRETFEDVAQKFIKYAKTQHPSPPTFVMVRSVRREGRSLRHAARASKARSRGGPFSRSWCVTQRAFLKGNYDQALTALFGSDAWRECAQAADRTECLMRTFQEAVTGQIADYVLPYKVHEDEKQTVLYYLVHLTNNDLGMRVMKEKMIKKSGEMTFFPITLRPKDQLGLDVAEKPPFPSLQAYLAKRYVGRALSFVDLLNEDYPRGHKLG